MLKSLLLRKMLKKQLAGVPESQQEQIITAIEKNPALFQNIAKEVQQKVQAGADQMTATMEVMEKYKDELKGAV